MTRNIITQQPAWPALCLVRRIVALLCLVMVTLGVAAQNNPYKIKDELYKMMVEAEKNRALPKGVQIAQKMYNRAVELNDKKGQCVALTTYVKCLRYESEITNAEYESALKKLLDTSRKYGYWQYYYNGTNFRLTHLLDTKQFQEAMEYAQEIHEYAFENNHPFGIYNGYRQLAYIRRAIGETRAAMNGYKEALNYGLKNLPSQDMSNCYLELCACSEINMDYKSILEYAEKGLPLSKTTSARLNLLRYKAMALFALGRYDEFKKTYDIINADSKYKSIYSSRLGIVIECFHIILTDQDVEKVEKLALQAYDKYARLTTMYWCYRYMGMYTRALEVMEEKYLFHIYTAHYTRHEDISSAEMYFKNMYYRMQKEQEDSQSDHLKLANNKLMLQKSKLNLERAIQAENIARLDAENYQLNYRTQRIEATQLADSLKMAKVEREERETQMRMQTVMMVLFMVGGMLILGIMAVVTYRIQKYSGKLQRIHAVLSRNNEQLEEERKKAERANNSKTEFIHNMTHELRVPLKAIIGAATVLSNDDIKCSDEEKAVLGDTINAQTQELLTLIDNTLAKTREEES